jgi:hypothetical protein
MGSKCQILQELECNGCGDFARVMRGSASPALQLDFRPLSTVVHVGENLLLRTMPFEKHLARCVVFALRTGKPASH